MFTRNQALENASLVLRRSNLVLSSTKITHQSPRVSTVNSTSTSSNRMWAEWTNWYHAFLSEVADEFPSLPIADRRSEATSRWVSFTAKNLKCSESVIRAWLRKSNQKALVVAYS
jgi:hypothetical protein